jgi:tetratricopeptide (TPR) repeat protein
LRIFWVLAAAACVGAAGAIFSMPWAKGRYQRWTGERAVARAQEFFAKGDFKHALLDARSALNFNPLDGDATRIVAKSLEAMGSRQAIEWRRRLNAISPGEPENVLALAKDAMKAGDMETAERTLSGLKGEDRNCAPAPCN